MSDALETLSNYAELGIERNKNAIHKLKRLVKRNEPLSEEDVQTIALVLEEQDDLGAAIKTVLKESNDISQITTMLDTIESGTLDEEFQTESEVASLPEEKFRMHRLSWVFKRGFIYTYNRVFNITHSFGNKKLGNKKHCV